MAAPRKSAAVLDARGAFKKDPQRKREEIEVKAPIQDPPTYMTAAQVAVWHELKAQVPEQILTKADSASFEAMVFRFADFRQNAALWEAKDFSNLMTMFANFGLTPAARLRFAAPAKKKTENPFGEI